MHIKQLLLCAMQVQRCWTVIEDCDLDNIWICNHLCSGCFLPRPRSIPKWKKDNEKENHRWVQKELNVADREFVHDKPSPFHLLIFRAGRLIQFSWSSLFWGGGNRQVLIVGSLHVKMFVLCRHHTCFRPSKNTPEKFFWMENFCRREKQLNSIFRSDCNFA